jgi:ribonucleotide reductase alpha subunit
VPTPNTPAKKTAAKKVAAKTTAKKTAKNTTKNTTKQTAPVKKTSSRIDALKGMGIDIEAMALSSQVAIDEFIDSLNPGALHIDRHFTSAGQDPFGSFTFERRIARIGSAGAKAVFEMQDVEVPDFWDQTATDILASKYFRKTGVPQFDLDGNQLLSDDGDPILGSERSIRQTALRLANAWKIWGERGGYFETPADAETYRDEMAYMLTAQMAAPNSPAWFNVGIFEAYGIIQTPDGSWYFDPELGQAVESKHRYERAAVNACFVSGTLITTEHGLVPIERLEVGDTVLTHLAHFRPITALNVRDTNEDIVELSIEGIVSPILVTSEHPFYVVTSEQAHLYHAGAVTPEWVKAGDIKLGDQVVAYPNDDPTFPSIFDSMPLSKGQLRSVTASSRVAFEGPVYNIQVAQDETYCVQGIIVHNCFISNMEDELVGPSSIFEFAEREARLFSQGSGSGVNMSKLRAKGEPLSGGGVTSGVLSFMKFLDDAAGAIKSGGTTRRAAKMVILDVDHPEVEDFIAAKAHEEKKAAALVAMGYDGSYEGEAISSVAFQNANHSVRITRGFMQALENDGDWELLRRTDGEVDKTIKARDLWDQIAQAAWECADPGLQFDDILNDWNTVADTERLRGTNPCFPGSALVYTNHGPVAFSELFANIQRGETYQVWTDDETNVDAPTHTTTLSSPECYMITGVNPIVSLVFSDGSTLRCTPTHKIFTTNRGFVRANELTPEDLVKTQTQPRYLRSTEVTLVSITDDGQELTYNLSEPKNHSYIVDGIVVKNCSEYVHVDDTACNLASFNLVKFYDDTTATFDVEAFEYAVRLWTLTLEIHVSMSHYPARIIAEKSYEHRTLGLGYANLGALLMRAGLAYDSDEARAAMGAITALMHNRAYATSAEMALAVGPGPFWSPNKVSMARVLHNHRRAAYGSLAEEFAIEPYEALTIEPHGINHEVLLTTPFANLSQPVLDAAEASQSGIKTGYRNAQISVLAPTGCSPADTLIITDQGTLPLGSFGDPDGPQWQDPAYANIQALTDEGYRPITKFFVNGYAEVACVETKGGYRLRATPEHRIKVMDATGHFDWRRIAEIRAGDEVLVYSKRFQNFGTDEVSRDAYLDGSELTYDLSVPANVTYIANGFVSHNTIGLVMSCDTTGVEPDFALVKNKKLAGGGTMRIINASVVPALERLGYSESEISRIMDYAMGTQSLYTEAPINAGSLAARGDLTSIEIDLAAAVVPKAFNLTGAFERYVIGDRAYKDLAEDATGYDLLLSLGFTDAEIASSSDLICGHKTVDGALDLRPEHLAVFDCAVECGDSDRSIAWTGHVAALAAVAPHISGSISKTVNLPNSATVADIEEAYRTAYLWGVKCVAVYRDGSKVAQPLNSAKAEELTAGEGEIVVSSAVPYLPPITPGMSPSQYYGANHPVPRFRPPNPRFGPTWRIEVGGEEIYIRVNTYLDGSPAEVFTDWGRQGSALKGMTNALSIAVSHALQRGMPLDDIIKAFRNQTFEPNGVVSGHENLKMANSVIDALVRILGYYFNGREDLVQVQGGLRATDIYYGPKAGLVVPDDTDSPEPITPPPSTLEMDKAHEIVAKGAGQRLYDQTCSSCGSQNMIRAGSCFVCGDCGNTTGCS